MGNTWKVLSCNYLDTYINKTLSFEVRQYWLEEKGNKSSILTAFIFQKKSHYERKTLQIHQKPVLMLGRLIKTE